MADISKIKLPDGVTYNVKDTNAARTSHTQKADTISGGYLFTHPESSTNATIIPFMNNDIAWLLKRGGSAVVKYDGVTQSVDISNVFDGSPAFWIVDNRNITTIVIELTLHKVFTWTNMAYCDFGSAYWLAKSIKIEVMNTNYASDVWTTKLNITNNSSVYATADVSHTPVGASNAGGGFNKIKFTFTDWYGIGTTNFRVAQLGIVNYNGLGLREPYMSRGTDDAVWRNITPAGNNSYNLGAVSYKWANGYFTNINGVSVGDSPKFTDNNTTYALSTSGNNIVLTPSSGSANTITVPYATNAGKVNNLTVQTAVPANAVFTDTKVTQTVVSSGDETEYRVLLSSSNAMETTTDGVKMARNIFVKENTLLADTITVSNQMTVISGSDFSDIHPGVYYSNGRVICNDITCNSMSVQDISSQYTFSKTSGNWSIKSFEVWRMGNFIQMRITFKGNGSNVASGSNGFVGAITGGAIPVCESKLTGYYGDMAVITNISKEGNITARVCGGTSSTISASGAMGVAGYFLTND